MGRHIADESDYRRIARPLLPYLLRSVEPGFEFEVEIITRAIGAGLEIDGVPVSTIYGDQGSHIRPVAHVAEFVRFSWSARRSVGIPGDLDDTAGTYLDPRSPASDAVVR